MKQRALLLTGIGLATIGVIGLTIVALATGMGFVPNMSPYASGRAGVVDAMFIERMVPHHQDAIDMADLAVSRAQHTEIRELASRIKQSQSDQNQTMREWYQDWFGRQVPVVSGGNMMDLMMGDSTDLVRLREAEDFDREFIEQMVPHHQMAIMMAQMAGRAVGRPELRQLTATIIADQSREIADMQRWYEEWYGSR